MCADIACSSGTEILRSQSADLSRFHRKLCMMVTDSDFFLASD